MVSDCPPRQQHSEKADILPDSFISIAKLSARSGLVPHLVLGTTVDSAHLRTYAGTHDSAEVGVS